MDAHGGGAPAGRWIATGSFDKTARVWDTELQMEVAALRGHSVVVSDVGWAEDGIHLATASYDGTVRLWRIA